MSNRSSKQVGAHNRHVVAVVATGLLALVITLLTLSPTPPDIGVVSSRDKLYHFVAFAALLLPSAVLYAHALVWVLPAALLFGAGIEVIQPFFGRSSELADFWADAFGVGFGTVLGLSIRAFLNRRFPPSST